MTITRKLFAVLLISLIITTGFASTAYAEESTTTEVQTEVSSTESTVTSTDGTAEGQDQNLEEGYYTDEQGQVYYDPSIVDIEEPVIEDIPEEDSTEAEVAEDADQDSEDQATEEKATDSKTETQKKDKPEPKKPSYSKEDLRLLSCLIYSEAGNQSYQGMLAVANVVLNRAKSDVYWHVNTVKEVIYDHKWSVQFSVTIKNKKTGLSMMDKALKSYDTGKFPGPNPEAQKKAMDRAIKAAKDALEGKNNIGNYLCFTSKYGSNSIKKNYPDYKIIGDHIFYRTK